MTERNPRVPARLTKTQALRQAKTAAVVREYKEKESAAAKSQLPDVPSARVRTRPRPTPKKVDFSKPGITKTMMARIKHAEKLKEELERKQQQIVARPPKRTPAPIAGDARLGRSRAKKGISRREPEPVAESTRLSARSKRKETLPIIPEKTCELARSINADVIQAEPVGAGPIDSVVIPPGMISDNRATVISIPQEATEVAGSSQLANRSIQVISEALDAQDAAEATVVQDKLEDMQYARRDFVLAVTSIAAKVVNIGEELVKGDRPPFYYNIPQADDPFFQVEYGRDHPVILAAREMIKKNIASRMEREAEERMQQEFGRMLDEPLPYDLQLEVPFEQELQEELSWEEDEAGFQVPVPSALHVPKRQTEYRYDPFDPEELGRFFDVKRYPSSPPPRRPLPGREHLPSDLWDLDDPWYRPASPIDTTDLIDFESY